MPISHSIPIEQTLLISQGLLSCCVQLKPQTTSHPIALGSHYHSIGIGPKRLIPFIIFAPERFMNQVGDYSWKEDLYNFDHFLRSENGKEQST